jgi:hypothetical protein
VTCAALSALAINGCDNTGGETVPGPGHTPRTTTEREAANVVRAYDRAIRSGDESSVCRIVGGTELDEFRCRTEPSIPADRRSQLANPRELRINLNDSPTGWIFLSGSASGSDIGLHYKVSRARGALRVTSVQLGYAM